MDNSAAVALKRLKLSEVGGIHYHEVDRDNACSPIVAQLVVCGQASPMLRDVAKTVEVHVEGIVLCQLPVRRDGLHQENSEQRCQNQYRRQSSMVHTHISSSCGNQSTAKEAPFSYLTLLRSYLLPLGSRSLLSSSSRKTRSHQKHQREEDAHHGNNHEAGWKPISGDALTQPRITTMNPHDPTTQLLLEALQERRTVEATYHDSKGGSTTRQIAVLSLGHQYFTGYCYLRDELRTFKVTRLAQLAMTDKRFENTSIFL